MKQDYFTEWTAYQRRTPITSYMYKIGVHSQSDFGNLASHLLTPEGKEKSYGEDVNALDGDSK